MKASRLALSCLLTNVLITSQSFSVFAETALSRYEDFKNGYIVVNDNTQLKPVDVEIEGNTLVSPMRNPSFGSRGKLNMIKMDNGRIINDSTAGVSEDNNYYMIEYGRYGDSGEDNCGEEIDSATHVSSKMNQLQMSLLGIKSQYLYLQTVVDVGCI